MVKSGSKLGSLALRVEALENDLGIVNRVDDSGYKKS